VRYTLRNKDKLIEAFDKEFYFKLECSIDWAIAINVRNKRGFELIDSDRPEFKMIEVNEINGTRVFQFYVVSVTFDCWVLGFKKIKGE